MTTQCLGGSRFTRAGSQCAFLLSLILGALGAILLPLILGTLAVFSAPKGENVLDNPGFEEPEPAKWESKNESFPGLWSYSWSSGQVHSGNHSAGIDISLSAYNGWWQSTPPVLITATRPYTFSGWIRAEGIENQAFLTLVFLDAGGREIMTTDSTAVSNSTDWVQVRSARPVFAPIDAISACIRCQLVGRGTAWYDDILLYPEPGDFADLQLEKRAQPIAVQAGQVLTYTLMYSNTGDALAKDVVIVDALPPSVTVVYSNPPANVQLDPYTLVWEVGDLAGDSMPHAITIAVMVSTTMADGQLLTNMATVVGEVTPLVTRWVTTEIILSPKWFAHLPIVTKNYPLPIVLNGGFEQGWTGWTRGGELHQTVPPDNPHSGELSALLGDPNYQCKNGVPIGSAWIQQVVHVPSTDYPELSFWYNIFTHDKNSDLGDKYDSFDVKIFDVKINGLPSFRDMNTTNPYKCDNLRNLGWRHATIDLGPFRGADITIRFENWNRFDNWYNTWTYVDDVQVDP